MKTSPVEHYRIITSFTTDSQAHMTHSNTSNSDGWKGNKHVTPFQKSQKVNFGHIAREDKLVCITISNTLANMAIKTAQVL